MRAAPAVSCAIAHRKRAHEQTGSAGASRPSLRSGFTAYFVLSPVNGFLATVAAWISRSIRRIDALPRNLTPAPRRQDHTTSPYASCALVLRAIRVHRISPRVRDVRTPLVTGETAGITSLICPTARAEYFCEGGWPSQITLNHLAKFTLRRSPFFSISTCTERPAFADLPDVGQGHMLIRNPPASLQHPARSICSWLDFLKTTSAGY